MTKNNTFFSIITPTYNCKNFIKENIRSVNKQTFKNFEHIIVDGFSKDGTQKILKKNRKKFTKLIIKKDNSMYEALKTGFNVAKGKYFMWLNADDFLYNKYSLENLYHCLIKFKYNWINGRVSIYYNSKKKLFNFIPLVYPKKIIVNGLANNCFWGFIQQENTVFSKKIYKDVGGINKNFKMAGDYDLWKRLAVKNSLKSINISIAVHRKWSNYNSPKGQLTNLNEYYKEIKKIRCKYNLLYPLRFIISILLYPIIYFRK